MKKNASLESTDDSVEQLVARAEKHFRRECDNLTALLFRWNDAPTDKAPLLGLSAPELDQRQLWRDTRKRRMEKRSGGDTASAASQEQTPVDEIEATIAEIESFVDDVDELLG